MIANELGSYRYSDPDLAFRDNPALIQQGELTKLHGMMQDLLDQPDVFRKWFGEFISQSRHELDLAPPEPAYSPDEIQELLSQGNLCSASMDCGYCVSVIPVSLTAKP